ncbi:transposase [Nocardia gipuzkoensis]
MEARWSAGHHDPSDGTSTLTNLYGIEPRAARLLADTGDVGRFVNRDRFASWNGTAPLDASAGDQNRHRLSRAGSRKINRVLAHHGRGPATQPSAGRT